MEQSPTLSTDPGEGSSAHPLQRPTKQDWETLKELIDDLYKAKWHTVRHICAVLKEKGYDVSEKMVKDRLKKWGLTKNKKLRDEHVRAMLRIREERKQQGRATPVFVVHGRKRDLESIEQSSRRKRINRDGLQEMNELTAPTPSDLDVLSPRSETSQALMPANVSPHQHRFNSPNPVAAEALTLAKIVTPRQIAIAQQIHTPGEIPRSPSIAPDSEHEQKTLNAIDEWYRLNLKGYMTPALNCRPGDGCAIYPLLNETRDCVQSFATFNTETSLNALHHELPAKAKRSIPNITPMSFLNALYWFTMIGKVQDEGETDSKKKIILKILACVLDMLSRVAVECLDSSEHPIALLFGMASSGKISVDVCHKVWAIMTKHIMPQLGRSREDMQSRSALVIRFGRLLQAFGEFGDAERTLTDARGTAQAAGDGHLIAVIDWHRGTEKAERRIPFEADELYRSAWDTLREHKQTRRELGISILEKWADLMGNVIEDFHSSEQLYAQAIQLHENVGHENLIWKTKMIRAVSSVYKRDQKTEDERKLRQDYPLAFKMKEDESGESTETQE